MFKFKDFYSVWPENEKVNGYTALEASEMVKELVLKYKDKLPKEWVSHEPWLKSTFVYQMAQKGEKENFELMAKNGEFKTIHDINAFRWNYIS